MWSSWFTSTDCIETPFSLYLKFMFTSTYCLQTTFWLIVKFIFHFNRLYPNPILTVCEVHVLLQKIVSKPYSDSIWSSCFTSADCVQTPFWQHVKFMFYCKRLYPNPILTVFEVHVLFQQIVSKPHSDSMWSSCFTAMDCFQTPFWQYVKFVFYCKRLYPNPILTVFEVHVLFQQIVSKPLSVSMWSSCWTSTDCIQTPFWEYLKFMFYFSRLYPKPILTACEVHVLLHFNRLYPNPILTVCEVHVLLQQIVSKPHSDSMWSSCFTSTDCIQTPFWQYVKFMFYFNRLYPNPWQYVKFMFYLQQIVSKPHSDSIWSSCFVSTYCIQTHFWQHYVRFMFYFNKLYPNPILTVCEVHVLLQQIVSKPHSDNSMWSSCFTATYCIQIPLLTVRKVHVLLQQIVSKPHSDSIWSSCFTSAGCVQTPFWRYVKFMFYFNRLYPNLILTVCEVHVLLQQIVSKSHSDSMWSSCFTSTDCIQTPFWQYVKFMFYFNRLYPNLILTVCEVHVLMQQIVSKSHSDCLWSSCFTSTDCIQTPFWSMWVHVLLQQIVSNPILTDCEVEVHVVFQQTVSNPHSDSMWVHVLLQQIVSKPHSDWLWRSCCTSTDCIQTPFWQYMSSCFTSTNCIQTHSDWLWSSCCTSTDCIQTPFWQYMSSCFTSTDCIQTPFILTVCEVHVLLQQIVSKPLSDSMWSSCFTSTDCIQTTFWQYVRFIFYLNRLYQTPFWQYVKFMFYFNRLYPNPFWQCVKFMLYFNRLYPNPFLIVCEVHVLLQQIVSKPRSDCLWSSCCTSTDCIQTPFWQYVKFMFYCNILYPNPILTVCEVHVLMQQIVSKPHSDCMWSLCFTSTDCIQTPFWLYVKFMFDFNRLYPNPILTDCEVPVVLQQIVSKPILTVCKVHVLLQHFVSKPHSDSIWSSCFASTYCIQTHFWQHYVRFMFYFNKLYPNPILTVCEVHVLLQHIVSKPHSDNSMWSSCFTATYCIQIPLLTVRKVHVLLQQIVSKPHSDSIWSSCFTSAGCVQTPFWRYVKFMFYFSRLYPNLILTVCEVHVLLQQIVSKSHSDSMWSSCFTSTDCIQTPFWQYVKFMFYFNRLYPNLILTVCEVHVLMQQIVSKSHSDCLWSSCFTSTDCIQTPFWSMWVHVLLQQIVSNPILTDCEVEVHVVFQQTVSNPHSDSMWVHVLLQQIVSKPHSDWLWRSCCTSTDCIQTPFWQYMSSCFTSTNCIQTHSDWLWSSCCTSTDCIQTPFWQYMSSCFTSTDCIQTPFWLYMKFMFYFNRLYPNPILTVCEVHVCEVHVLLQQIVSKPHSDGMWLYVQQIVFKPHSDCM